MEILREDNAKEFIKRLPEITQTPATCHLLMLIIRKKKALEMLNEKMKDAIVEKTIIRENTDWRMRYFSKLYNLALLQHQGRYDSDAGVIIAPAAMGIFATLAPRDVIKSVVQLTQENVELGFRHDKEAMEKLTRQSSTLFRLLHGQKQKGYNFQDFDIDENDDFLHNKVRDLVSSYPIFIDIGSSRGYHIVVNLTKGTDAGDFYKKNVIEIVKAKTHGYKIDVTKDPQIPVPGTYYSSSVRPEPNFVTILN